jgi:hypothetical protein
MNNTIEDQEMSANNLYETLQNYPILKEPVRYPKRKTPNDTIRPHDMIIANLANLVPNLTIGYQMNMEANQLIDWVTASKNYAEKINKEFQEKCERRMKKIIRIEEHKERAKQLDMNKLDRLPEDIIRYIHDFLLPETRIVLLRARYPNLNANIMKLKLPQLKCFSANIQTKIYNPMMRYIDKNDRRRCLPDGFYARFSVTKKQNFLDNIEKFMGTCERAVAHNESDHRYFQRKTLRILRSLIYVAKTKQVLDKAYAPELETPPPPEKKKRGKGKPGKGKPGKGKPGKGKPGKGNREKKSGKGNREKETGKRKPKIEQI